MKAFARKRTSDSGSERSSSTPPAPPAPSPAGNGEQQPTSYVGHQMKIQSDYFTSSSNTLVFCYGSNSIEQVRERCNSQRLQAIPASIKGWTRIFAGSSNRWEGGGVASIVKDEKSTVLGTAVWLNKAELRLLDTCEGIAVANPYSSKLSRYYRVKLTISTVQGEEEGEAYVRTSSEWENPPSQSYLEACWRNIAGSHRDKTFSLPILDSSLKRRGSFDGTDLWKKACQSGIHSPLYKSASTIIQRLNKHKFFASLSTTVNPAAALAKAKREQINVFVGLAVYELSHLNAVESSFFAKIRLHRFFQYPTSAVPKDLLNRAIADGGMTVLKQGEDERLTEEGKKLRGAKRRTTNTIIFALKVRLHW
jgi:hypothetical protein